MLNIMEVHETNKMIEQEKLDVRTITMGISLLDCAADSVDEVCENIYNKITTYAKDLVSTGQAIERDFGIPIVNMLTVTADHIRTTLPALRKVGRARRPSVWRTNAPGEAAHQSPGMTRKA